MTGGKKSFARSCLDITSNQGFIRYTSCAEGFPGGSVVKNPSAHAGDGGLITKSGTFPGGGNGSPLQYSCLENSMDREAWLATIMGLQRVRKTEHADTHTHTHTHTNRATYIMTAL